jgi:hypothetical protein
MTEKHAKNKHFPAETEIFSTRSSGKPFTENEYTERHEKAPNGTDAVRNPVRRQNVDALMLPADLREIVESWETLPEAVRAGIFAMVKAASIGRD